MVNVGTGTSKTRFVKTKYPVEKGLTAGTTKQTGKITNLVPVKSLVSSKEKEGLK